MKRGRPRQAGPTLKEAQLRKNNITNQGAAYKSHHALRYELGTALDTLDSARKALERATRLDGDPFVLDALRVASAELEAIRRRVKNAAELARPARGAA